LIGLTLNLNGDMMGKANGPDLTDLGF